MQAEGAWDGLSLRKTHLNAGAHAGTDWEIPVGNSFQTTCKMSLKSYTKMFVLVFHLREFDCKFIFIQWLYQMRNRMWRSGVDWSVTQFAWHSCFRRQLGGKWEWKPYMLYLLKAFFTRRSVPKTHFWNSLFYLWCTALCSPPCLTDTVIFSANLLVGAAPSAVTGAGTEAGTSVAFGSSAAQLHSVDAYHVKRFIVYPVI